MKTHTLELENSENEPRLKLLTLISKVYLLLNLAVFFAFAVGFFIAPTMLADQIGFSIHSTAALADFRAMYGGLCLGIGILILLGILQTKTRIAAIQISVLTAGGLLLGRLITLILDGPGNEYIYISMLTEVFGIALGFFLLRK
ncbi:PF14248 domain protein [Leptospira broomii serovar Hurstbridge str. 5399]|uniref:PF14248 domain protein n=1 Tax=Leptospira broomii serovar Hurstbridge str. 5399 TaxID=1049789 RepID=T0GC84_9LEPT|nr:DUF4345 family protein [Leptospira broomii]EQA44444.1 PF14248 domain protein [Leptospira broomii serovar Hurstbridge str. 5399]